MRRMTGDTAGAASNSGAAECEAGRAAFAVTPSVAGFGPGGASIDCAKPLRNTIVNGCFFGIAPLLENLAAARSPVQHRNAPLDGGRLGVAKINREPHAAIVDSRVDIAGFQQRT